MFSVEASECASAPWWASVYNRCPAVSASSATVPVPPFRSPPVFTPRSRRLSLRDPAKAWYEYTIERAWWTERRVDRRNMMSETVVTMDGSSNNASNNPRQVPTVKTEPGQPNPLAGVRLNLPYFKTIPGIIKLVQLVSTRDITFFIPFAFAVLCIKPCLRRDLQAGNRELCACHG